MALAVNILALVLVIAFVWVGMVWFSGWFHRRSGPHAPDGDVEITSHPHDSEAPCRRCDGVGATVRRGDLRPCERCEGTGVDPAFF